MAMSNDFLICPDQLLAAANAADLMAEDLGASIRPADAQPDHAPNQASSCPLASWFLQSHDAYVSAMQETSGALTALSTAMTRTAQHYQQADQEIRQLVAKVFQDDL